jgi:hypothetical protein
MDKVRDFCKPLTGKKREVFIDAFSKLPKIEFRYDNRGKLYVNGVLAPRPLSSPLNSDENIKNILP